MATPKKAVVLYSPLTNTLLSSALDDLCTRGCSGQLIIEDQGPKSVDNTHLDIIQLLGLSSTEPDQMKTRLVERFGKMQFGVLSSSLDIVELAKALEFPVCLALETSPTPAEIVDILNSVEPRVDLLLIDIRHKDAWESINSLVKDLIDTTPEYLKVIVGPAESKQSDLGTQNWWDSLVPEQSHVKKEGQLVSTDPGHSLVCSYLHNGSTRRDNVKRFIAEDIIENGCNGKILAWHFLGEIGHKLGFVPKYGA
ncbi:hypothetical protein CLU79DRAFT_850056 [Phycomyces nitens]|nr:hypothetical protein CLU79DRAFT_850056 [Phycomyces nitens]